MNALDPKLTLPQDTGLRGYELWLHIRKTIEGDPDSWNQESWAGRELPDSADYDLRTHRWTEATPTLLNDHGIEVVVPTCGTALCVAGWAAELTGDPAAFRVGSLNTDFTLSGLSISTADEMALELDHDQSAELFASSNDLDRLDELAAWIWQGGPHPDKGECCTCGTRDCDGCYADDEYSDNDYVMDDGDDELADAEHRPPQPGLNTREPVPTSRWLLGLNPAPPARPQNQPPTIRSGAFVVSEGDRTMSKETLAHLNTNTLIGNTDKRGFAWHYRAEDQGDESNHYPGFVPVGDIVRRLFNWEAEQRALAVEVPEPDAMVATHVSAGTTLPDGTVVGAGVQSRWVVVPDRKATARSDRFNGDIMGIFKSYDMHQYRPWLLDNVATILDGELGVSSAGLLKDGAIAWVEISVPDSITTPEGVDFRPNLLATTSFDGSIATTFKRTLTDTVCDNTRECALGEKGQQYKVKHSRYSQLRIGEARRALAMVYTLADKFAAEVKQLVETPVSNKQWLQFVDLIVPTTVAGKELTGRSLTNARNKTDALTKLYKFDPRVAPWTGTAHGVLQAVNTWEHHGNRVTGDRGERNMLLTVQGKFGEIDRSSWATLNKVLVTA